MTPTTNRPGLSARENPNRRAIRQSIWLGAAALALYAGVRSLPVDAGVLHYADFGVGQPGALELCVPGGPQFVPVDRVRSPVTMTVRSAGDRPVRMGEAAQLLVTLTAASGKPVTLDDLLVSHTRKLHLLLIDPSLEDYQHLHPEATGVKGEFVVAFFPRRSGEYRVFADFTPRATGRALYSGARLQVGLPLETGERSVLVAESHEVVVEGYRFVLDLDREMARINEIAELRLSVTGGDGAPAQLEEIMGARAHVVAFDVGRTGFAHLHPVPTEGDGVAEVALRFQLSLGDPGVYRLWAQVQIKGRELFAPFTLVVRP